MDFRQNVETIVRQDPRYKTEAYEFVSEAVGYTCELLECRRHITGQELLEGIRECALEKFGPLAKFMLNEWGVRCCGDFGYIVFNMVNMGLLGKTEQDRIEDFSDGYDFEEAFEKPFEG